MKQLVIMYEKKTTVLARAIRSASFSFAPSLGPRALLHTLHSFKLSLALITWQSIAQSGPAVLV